MTRLAICLLSVLALVASQGAPRPVDTCDSVKMQACTASLAQEWGYTMDEMHNFWKDRHVFDEMITAKYGKNAEDYVYVCNGLNLFYYCIGPSNIQYCMGVSGLTSNQMTAFDAYQMDGMMNRLRFECGDAFYPITSFPDATECIQRTKKNYVQNFGAVTDSYENQIQHDTYDNVCKNANGFVSNITDIYRKGPCSEYANPQALTSAQWYGCNGARQHVLAQYRHCESQIACGGF
ncbi:hypothetical protein PRIPAC_72577 [Pristionchus pacificus]|uniref:Uncharacterized protein n=1 Tax=Pristionchus pacificus TaxID=54126 RepID=A0A2A6BEV0_PRIPA|nr:hypothetical protein PRIPAC_72577 [Pristionchus pacificus]|eukprot:PDM64404.1 hypothetical protein PRIPAC_52660 [Pristionchus pacificus]